MSLVPLGLNMEAWSRATRTTPVESRSAPASNSVVFTNNSGREIFHGVRSITHGSGGGGGGSLDKKGKKELTQKMVTPVQSVLERTKERDQTSDAPNDNNISLDMAAVSRTKQRKAKTRKKPAKSRIKQLMTARRGQSKSGGVRSKTSASKIKKGSKGKRNHAGL